MALFGKVSKKSSIDDGRFPGEIGMKKCTGNNPQEKGFDAIF
jgi:hypothetical protein